MQALQMRESGRLSLGVYICDRKHANRVLPALTGVRATPYAVDSDGQSLVRLPGERAQRHASRAEALHDGLHRLYGLQRYRLSGAAELQHVADGGGGAHGDALLVQLVHIVVLLSQCLVQKLHQGLVVVVVVSGLEVVQETVVEQLGGLPCLPVLHLPLHPCHHIRKSIVAESDPRELCYLSRQVVVVQPAYPGGSTWEGPCYHLVG
mmetsp:Transcript_9111/g.20067  ORF Transcript_9111/g.20067 Transcript_9111/m.20067 type:complete len:207 (-) Transcript_9111:2737-3357(-)